VVVPVEDIKIQQQIAELIKKSFYLCSKSKWLLDEDKNMVEKEIEKKRIRTIKVNDTKTSKISLLNTNILELH
jgi:hypothetical protein